MDGRYQEVRRQRGTRKGLFQDLLCLTKYLLFESWQHLLDFMLDDSAPSLTPRTTNTSWFWIWNCCKAVQAIEQRGGKVVFIRFPSSGELRTLENKFSPRQLFWEQILSVSGANGIHFEDYPELSSFECPEWSHLTKEDSIEFTRNLMPILEDILESSNSNVSKWLIFYEVEIIPSSVMFESEV